MGAAPKPDPAPVIIPKLLPGEPYSEAGELEPTGLLDIDFRRDSLTDPNDPDVWVRVDSHHFTQGQITVSAEDGYLVQNPDCDPYFGDRRIGFVINSDPEDTATCDSGIEKGEKNLIVEITSTTSIAAFDIDGVWLMGFDPIK